MKQLIIGLAFAMVLSVGAAFEYSNAGEFSGGGYVPSGDAVIHPMAQDAIDILSSSEGLSQEEFENAVSVLFGQTFQPRLGDYRVAREESESHFSGGNGSTPPVSDPNYVPTGPAALLINLLTRNRIVEAIVDISAQTLTVRNASVVNRTSRMYPKTIGTLVLQWDEEVGAFYIVQ